MTVVVGQESDRALLTYPGSIRALRFDDIPLSRLRQARHLHSGGYCLLDDLLPDIPELFRTVHPYGLTTSLDPNDDPYEV